MRWLNRTVLGIGLASLFSDWSHEIATNAYAGIPRFDGDRGGVARPHRRCERRLVKLR